MGVYVSILSLNSVALKLTDSSEGTAVVAAVKSSTVKSIRETTPPADDSMGRPPALVYRKRQQ